MLGSIPVISPLFQYLLDGIGWVLARLYDVIPNYGLAIILLTLLIRLILVPLGVKQLKSMQAMQALQPKMKEIQKKFRSNKQRAQEETMKLYREHGVNPLGGCLPLLLQLPVLISMYSVIRPPMFIAQKDDTGAVTAYEIHNNHLPEDSKLFENVIKHQDLDFIWMNLQCSVQQAGGPAASVDTDRQKLVEGLPILGQGGVDLSFPTKSQEATDCGDTASNKVPYALFLVAMIGTTFYQQRQMQRVSPPGASQQQQMLMKIMPFTFAIWGFFFPAGLLMYWCTSNLWQIGQQYVLLKAGHIGPDAIERRKQELASRPPSEKRGFMARLAEQAESERERRAKEAGTMRKPGSGKNPQKPTGGKPGQGKKKKPGGSGGSGTGKDRPKR